MSYDRRSLRWNGWGFAAHDELAARNEALWAFLADALGVRALPSTPAAALDAVTLAPSRLSSAAQAAFTAAGFLLETGHFERCFHARGDSYRDLLDLRAGGALSAPDAIVFPETAEACDRLLQLAAAHDVAVVPFGGGTSVVGGVAPLRGAHHAVIAVSTTRMTRLISVDKTSMTATAETGLYGPMLEQKLQAEGVTLGHFPQSFEFSTLGGWIAARGAGQQSTRYGKAEHWLSSARLSTPQGPWRTNNAPASAAGPRLTDLVAGSEGVLGLITEASFIVHPKPMARDLSAYLFHSFEDGVNAVREIMQSEIPAATLRLSDEDETHFYGALGQAGQKRTLKHRLQDFVLRQRGFGTARAALIAGTEGAPLLTSEAAQAIRAIARKHGAMRAGSSPAKRWFAGRFHGPYLRDPMLDRSLGVDTLETAARWSALPGLYKAVRSALHGAMNGRRGGRGIVLGHISHAYRDGASLYFTYVWPRSPDGAAAEIAEWMEIKTAASNAICSHGGTISHHHGAGVDHAPWLQSEHGETGMQVLRALKAALDPKAIMNPGKLGL